MNSVKQGAKHPTLNSIESDVTEKQMERKYDHVGFVSIDSAIPIMG